MQVIYMPVPGNFRGRASFIDGIQARELVLLV